MCSCFYKYLKLFPDTLDRLYSNEKRAANIQAATKKVKEPVDEEKYAVVDTLQTGAEKTPETEKTPFKVPELPVSFVLVFSFFNSCFTGSQS